MRFVARSNRSLRRCAKLSSHHDCCRIHTRTVCSTHMLQGPFTRLVSQLRYFSIYPEVIGMHAKYCGEAAVLQTVHVFESKKSLMLSPIAPSQSEQVHASFSAKCRHGTARHQRTASLHHRRSRRSASPKRGRACKTSRNLIWVDLV